MKITKLDTKYKINLRLYEESRFNHDECGDTKQRLYVKKVPRGTVFWCHNCLLSGYEKDSDSSPSETSNYIKYLNEKQNQETISTNIIKLPSDFSLHEIPPKGLLWLAKYNITEKERLSFGIGYSQYMNRLILPVYDKLNGNLIYWQGRNLGTIDKEHPKYLNIKKTGAKNVFFKRTRFDLNTPLVIVEDILSAIRVGRYANTLSLLGSYIPPTLLMQLTNEYKTDKVYLWLDSDKYKEAIKYAANIRATTLIKTCVICTTKDPKQTADDTIKQVINYA